jgi:type II secretory pathway component GspD/PulD (secretin)
MMRRIALVLALLVMTPLRAGATPLITLNAQGVDVSDVLSMLAAESGVNIVTDGSMKPERVTVNLRDVSFEEALDAIVTAHGLQVHREGTVLIVGTAESMNRRYGGLPNAEGTQTVVFSLSHASPDDVAKEIGDALPAGSVIIPDKRTGSVVVTADARTIVRARAVVAALDSGHEAAGTSTQTTLYKLSFVKPDDLLLKLRGVLPQVNAVADARQNAVLVTGGGDVQQLVAAIIADIDRASPQVEFEVRVADITPQNDTSDVGVEFGGLDLQGNLTPGQTTYAFANGTIPVNVRLNALISKGRAAILATPKLVTLNNVEADLTIGQTYPIVYSTSVFGGQNVQYVQIGVALRMTPTIGTDGSVTAEIHPEYSELEGFTATGYPIVTNRKIDSTLRVHDGETIVLGGLMRDASSETIEKVPWLADIPILGKFFQNKSTSHERDEIVFLITPHVIYPGAPPPQK